MINNPDNPCANIVNPHGQKGFPTMDNPLGLQTEYIWQAGDTMMLVALKYRRPGQWLELLDLNKGFLSSHRYIMRAGDTIQVPSEWFPLPNFEFGTRFVGSKGIRDVGSEAEGAEGKNQPEFYFRADQNPSGTTSE